MITEELPPAACRSPSPARCITASPTASDDTRLGGDESNLGGRLSTELGELLDDARERLGGIDLVGTGPAQSRFGLGQVAQNEFTLLRAPATRIGRALRDPAEKHVGGSA
jgi:hypothetical protein